MVEEAYYQKVIDIFRRVAQSADYLNKINAIKSLRTCRSLSNPRRGAGSKKLLGEPLLNQ